MLLSVRVDLKKILKKSRISSGPGPGAAPGVIPIVFGGTALFPAFLKVFRSAVDAPVSLSGLRYRHHDAAAGVSSPLSGAVNHYP